MNAARTLLAATLLFAPLPLHAQATAETGGDPVMSALMEDLRRGEAAEAELRRARDAHLADIRTRDLSPAQRDAKIRGVLDTYRQQSSKLVARYRQPLIEELKTRNPGLKDSMGTSLYLTDDTGAIVKDPAGKPKLNPDFRGWSGDHDLQGSPAAVQRVRQTLAQHDVAMTGAGSASLKDLTPGDLSAEALEMTINLDPTDQRWRDEVARLDTALEAETDPGARARLVTERNRAQRAMWAAREGDSMLKPGSSAHETVAKVAAGSKETYVVASMESNQIGRNAVAVNDHYKKAVSGFALDGSALMDPVNEAAFQGMVKGTGKALADADLSDADLARAMKGQGLMMSPGQYRKLLRDMKQNPVPDLYNLTPDTMESFRRVNMAVMDEAIATSGNRARQELDTRRAQLDDLDGRISAATGEDRMRLAAERERLGREYVDTQVKLQAVEDANATRRAQYGLEPGTRQTRPGTPDGGKVVSAPDAPDVPGSRMGTTMKQLGNAMDAAGKIADFVEIVTTTLDEADKAVASASPHDSDAELIARVTANATLRLTGVTEAMEQAFTPDNMAAFNRAAVAADFGTSVWEFGKLTGRVMFNWVAKKADDALFTPLKNIGEATVEGALLSGALMDEATGALRNLGEQTIQQIRIAMRDEDAAREAVRQSTPVIPEDENAAGAAHASPAAAPDLLAEAPPPDTPAPDVAAVDPPNAKPTAPEASPVTQTPPALPSLALSPVTVRRDTYDGPETPSLPVGGIVALTTNLTGTATDAAEVEWLLDGSSYKVRPLSEDNALGLRLDTTGMAPGSYAVTVRLTGDGGDPIQAAGTLMLTDPAALKVTLGSLSAHLETYDGAPLSGPVENGQILAFTLPLSVPEGAAGGTVRWQVFGPDQAAIAPLVKEETVGKTSSVGFRFRPEGLLGGTHEVRASFLPSDDGQAVQVVSTGFTVAGSMPEELSPPAPKVAAPVSNQPLTRPLWGTDPAFAIENSIWKRFLKMPKSDSTIDAFENLAWTADGTALMLKIEYVGDTTATALYTAEGDGQAAIKNAHQCISMTFSRSSLYCQFPGVDGHAKLAVVDRKTGRVIRDTTLADNGTDMILDLSPTGDRAAHIPAGYAYTAVYDTVSGREVGRHSERPPRDSFDTVAYDKKAMFGGKGRTLLVSTRLRKDANGGTSNHLELLDGTSGKFITSLMSSPDQTYVLEGVSPDDRYSLVSMYDASSNRTQWHLFDLKNRTRLWTINNVDPTVARHSTPVVMGNDAIFKHRIFNPGSKEANPRIELYAFDIATGAQRPTLVLPISEVFKAGDVAYKRVSKFAINPDGQHIAAHLAQTNGNSRLVVGTLESLR